MSEPRRGCSVDAPECLYLGSGGCAAPCLGPLRAKLALAEKALDEWERHAPDADEVVRRTVEDRRLREQLSAAIARAAQLEKERDAAWAGLDRAVNTIAGGYCEEYRKHVASITAKQFCVEREGKCEHCIELDRDLAESRSAALAECLRDVLDTDIPVQHGEPFGVISEPVHEHISRDLRARCDSLLSGSPVSRAVEVDRLLREEQDECARWRRGVLAIEEMTTSKDYLHPADRLSDISEAIGRLRGGAVVVAMDEGEIVKVSP